MGGELSQPGSWAVRCKQCGERYKWKGRIDQQPPCPKCFPEKRTAAAGRIPGDGVSGGHSYLDAIDQCNNILSLCDEIPDAGWDFAESVREKTESIKAWIEKHEEATDAQQEALDNMEAGAERWVNH